MNPRFVVAIAERILQQFRHDRRTLALLFVAPIVVLSLFAMVIRGGSTRPGVDIVNRDTGPLGTSVVTALERSAQVDAHTADIGTAARHLRDGSVAAYVVLPVDFSARIPREGVVAAELHLEGTQPTVTQPVTLALTQALAASVKALATTAGLRVPTAGVHVSFLHGGANLDTLDYLGAPLVGLIVFFLVFVVTIVSFLRERTQGTLERLMASPLHRADIVLGYMLGFGVIAAVQALEVLLFTLIVLHVHNDGSVLLIALIALLMTIGAVNLGVLLSMFARTEFQAVQFIPLAIVPQFFLSGVLFPVASEPGWLQYLSNVLPLTYAVSGLRDVMLRGFSLTASSVQLDVAVLSGYAIVLVVGAAATLRRDVA